MTEFLYRNGILSAESVALPDLAAAYGTPLYVYSQESLTAAFRAYEQAFAGMNATICHAVKANGNLAVLSHLGRLGAGADCVSGGEIRRALAARIPASKIVLSGVGKSEDEIRLALSEGILSLNLESVPELKTVNALAAAIGKTVNVALRVNPDVADAAIFDKTSTGGAETKFGLDARTILELFQKKDRFSHLRLSGLSIHIGSQILDLAPFAEAFSHLAELVKALKTEGHSLDRLDLGGGVGVPYGDEAAPDIKAYAALAQKTLGGFGCNFVLEPGRYLVGPAGILLTRILYIKEGAEKTFAIVDAAMNDLIRPTLYEAFHPIRPVKEAAAPKTPSNARRYDVVGPICETGDYLALDRALPPLSAGDLLAIGVAGAYGATMSSFYNARPLIAECLVAGERHACVRQRVSLEEQLAWENVPAWINA